ncbi:DUF1648 domain-containing protein [Saprospiraceae bacterium]|nr:DUF1648 domain-containing protein [Saprospiraceae bacterium]
MLKGQPKIYIEKKPLWSYIDYACVFLISFALAYAYLKYSELPDQIPIHFNSKEEADSYGSKTFIWFLPILSIALYVLLTVVSRYPHTFNYTVKINEENAKKQYIIAIEMMALLKLCIMIYFSYMTYKTIQIAMNGHGGLGFLSTLLLVGAIVLIIIRSLLQSSKIK